MTHEREMADMKRGTEQLEQQIQDVRRDWERKRRDPAVPGAPASSPDDADGGAVAGDWKGEGQAAGEAGQ